MSPKSASLTRINRVTITYRIKKGSRATKSDIDGDPIRYKHRALTRPAKCIVQQVSVNSRKIDLSVVSSSKSLPILSSRLPDYIPTTYPLSIKQQSHPCYSCYCCDFRHAIFTGWANSRKLRSLGGQRRPLGGQLRTQLTC